jgi:hypothetical protein
MDDRSALQLALDAARAFQRNERSPLETARIMTGIVDPWRAWWHDLGGAHGPLAQLYAAEDAAMELHWLGGEIERWHPDVREAKRRELQDAEDSWREPVAAACAALLRYAERE